MFTYFDGQVKFLLIKHALNHQWSLPKGHVEPGEATIQTAEREILEETGVQTKAIEFLGFTNIWSTHDNYHLLRRMHSYLLKPVGDTTLDPAKFDPKEHMISEAVWATPAEALKKVHYQNIRPLIKQAEKRLKELKHG